MSAPAGLRPRGGKAAWGCTAHMRDPQRPREWPPMPTEGRAVWGCTAHTAHVAAIQGGRLHRPRAAWYLDQVQEAIGTHCNAHHGTQASSAQRRQQNTQLQDEQICTHASSAQPRIMTPY